MNLRRSPGRVLESYPSGDGLNFVACSGPPTQGTAIASANTRSKAARDASYQSASIALGRVYARFQHLRNRRAGADFEPRCNNFFPRIALGSGSLLLSGDTYKRRTVEPPFSRRTNNAALPPRQDTIGIRIPAASQRLPGRRSQVGILPSKRDLITADIRSCLTLLVVHHCTAGERTRPLTPTPAIMLLTSAVLLAANRRSQLSTAKQQKQICLQV